MSNYTKTVDFAAKDTLPSGDSGKIIKGTEFETEFDNIATAIATKADSAAPTFTGTSVFTNLDINGTVQADGAVTVGVDDTGYDVKFFGATAGKSLLWDESADSLIVTGTTTLVGTTNLDAVDVDGDMTFADNSKAIFGAGSDLQIYHDELNSYITEGGVGNLYLAAANLYLRKTTGENLIYTTNAGAVITHYNGSAKLATTATGIDVTGIVVADGIESSGNFAFTAADGMSISAKETVQITIDSDDNDSSRAFQVLSGSSGSTEVLILASEDAGVTLYYDNAQKFATTSTGIDVTGSVTADDSSSADSTILTLANSYTTDAAGDATEIMFQHYRSYSPSVTDSAFIKATKTQAWDATGDRTSKLEFGTRNGATEPETRMTIMPDGSVGIGVVPEAWTVFDGVLQIGSGGAVASTAAITRLSNNIYYDGAYKRIATGTAASYIQNSGIHIWTSDVSGTGDVGFTPTERLRIDGSGNLMVGTIDSTPAVSSSEVGVALSGSLGYVAASRSAGASGFFNRLSDGDIVNFNKDGTSVGSIGTESGYLAVGSSNGQSGYLGFRSNMVYPSTSTGGNRDDIIDLGGSSQRFDDIYATNGTIQTSDRNEKQDIEELSDAEQRVAVAAKGLLRKFRWKSSVEEKGDEARTHFGIIAQDLQAAFSAEGLDAGDYAMFINSTWTDEETGEERSRMGVRYSELLAFIIAAI